MKSFESVFAYLQSNLQADTEIDNWTAFRGYLGNKMRVVSIREGVIQVDSPKARNLQMIPKGDFERIWKVWEDYKRQKVKRFELRDMTRFSKYILSILHWYDESDG